MNEALYDKAAEEWVPKATCPNARSCWVAEPTLELKAPNRFLRASRSWGPSTRTWEMRMPLCHVLLQGKSPGPRHVVSRFQKGFLDKMAFEPGSKSR